VRRGLLFGGFFPLSPENGSAGIGQGTPPRFECPPLEITNSDKGRRNLKASPPSEALTKKWEETHPQKRGGERFGKRFLPSHPSLINRDSEKKKRIEKRGGKQRGSKTLKNSPLNRGKTFDLKGEEGKAQPRSLKKPAFL